MGKLVHAEITKPHESFFKSFRNDKASAFTVTCDADHCEPRDRGECIRCNLLDAYCPHGTPHKEVGWTRRARKYHKWIADQELHLKDVPRLGHPTKVLAVVGDYIYLPYEHMTFNAKHQLEVLMWACGGQLLPREVFTLHLVQQIVDWRPRCWAQGEIKHYQEKSVPLFLRHLSERMPDLYKALLEVCPQAAEKTLKSNVGRKAVLMSLLPNIGTFTDRHNGTWVWDGEYLISTNSSAAFLLVSKHQIQEVQAKPTADVVVTITDDDQVTNLTQFIS